MPFDEQDIAQVQRIAQAIVTGADAEFAVQRTAMLQTEALLGRTREAVEHTHARVQAIVDGFAAQVQAVNADHTIKTKELDEKVNEISKVVKDISDELLTKVGEKELLEARVVAAEVKMRETIDQVKDWANDREKVFDGYITAASAHFDTITETNKDKLDEILGRAQGGDGIRWRQRSAP